MDSDGWTQIPPSRSRPKKTPANNPTANRPNNHTPHSRQRTNTLDPQTANPPDTRRDLATLTAHFTRETARYNTSACRKTAHRLLARAIGRGVYDYGADGGSSGREGKRIRQAVCLASGSFSCVNEVARARAVVQVVAFLDLVAEVARLQGGEGVEVLAQDPAYTDVDAAFLVGRGVRVVGLSWEGAREGGLGPVGEFLVGRGEGVLVFEPFMEFSRGFVREVGRLGVGVYVGSSVARAVEEVKGGREIGEEGYREVVERWKEAYGSVYFPEYDFDANVFQGMMMHWKEEREDNEDG